MRQPALSTVAVAALLALAACGPNSATPASPPKHHAGTAKTAQGAGVVKAVDRKAGTVTLQHGPIPEAGWPAMTMTFRAEPASLLDHARVGDEVRFTLRPEASPPEVVELHAK